jgi:hypothetical protein
MNPPETGLGVSVFRHSRMLRPQRDGQDDENRVNSELLGFLDWIMLERTARFPCGWRLAVQMSTGFPGVLPRRMW